MAEIDHILSNVLLTPFARHIEAHSRLIIVPYGVGHILPFHALTWDGQPLIATHTISYLPSASLLYYLELDSKRAMPDKVLAVGNPASHSYEPPPGGRVLTLAALPWAAKEAAYVATLFAQSKLLIGADATEQRVRHWMADYPVLHFAAHGYLSEEAPLLSSIVLAGGEALSVYELMGMSLDADLVVLSACQTALGQVTSGDEVLGLTRGLLGAGARKVVVSLWPVDDLSTSLFMGHFYKQLRAGASHADALRAAQNYLSALTPKQIAAERAELEAALEQRAATQDPPAKLDGEVEARNLRPLQWQPAAEDYSHPYFWAPFILVG
jgi:CHAT domain-containing protein